MSPKDIYGSIYDVQQTNVFYEKTPIWLTPSVEGNCGDLCIIHNTIEGKIRWYFHNDIEWVERPRDEIYNGSIWKDILLEGEGGSGGGVLVETHIPMISLAIAQTIQ